MGRVRVGQVGLGWFGVIHQQVWSEVPGIEMVGVCDTDPAALAGKAGPRAQDQFHVLTSSPSRADDTARPMLRTPDLDELLAAGIDVLDVVVTEANHAACCRLALESGVDVIVEKPLALTSDEAEDLFALAERNGRNIYVGHVLRFDPRYVAMRQAYGGGELRHLSFERHFQASALDVYGRVHPVLAAAIHDVDVAVWWLDRQPDRVAAFGGYACGRVFPDTLTIVLRWDNGPMAVIQNSWHLAPENPYGFVYSATIQAVNQTLVTRNEPDVWIWGPGHAMSPDLFLWPDFAGVRSGALAAELTHFTQCVAQKNSSYRVPVDHVRMVARVSDAVMASLANNGIEVAL